MLSHFWINSNKNIFNGIKINKLIEIIDFEISRSFRLKINLFYEISFLSKEKILLLNQKFRNKNYIADVISVPFWEEDYNFWFESSKNSDLKINNRLITNLIGEIYLCAWKIKNNAKNYGVSFISELSRMIIHGILHLFEFNHEISETMEYITLNIQDKINLKVIERYQNAK